MNNNENVKASATMMKEMSEYVKLISAVLPALSFVTLLAGKEFMLSQITEISERLAQFTDERSEEQSVELHDCMMKKESFERSLEKVRSLNKKDKLTRITTLVKASPVVMAKAAQYMNDHIDQILSLLESCANTEEG